MVSIMRVVLSLCRRRMLSTPMMGGHEGEDGVNKR